MEEFKIGQLTKELVSIQLKKMGDPCAVAAELVRKTLRVALKPGQAQTEDVIADAVQGGLQGLLLCEGDVPKGGVLVLEAVAELSAELQLDPTEALRGALAGLARLRRLLLPDQLAELQAGIEARFQGAGEVFAELLFQQPGMDDSSKTCRDS